MSADTIAGRCKQAGCDAGTTGTCINDLSLEECPDFKIEQIQSADEDTSDLEDTSVPSTEDYIVVRGGGGLTFTETNDLLMTCRAKLVALVGISEVGKTTLLAMLYELTRRRLFDRFGFAGSETIKGFEERCFLARMASERAQPDTQRTRQPMPPNFLHLRLSDRSTRSLVDVLMSDRSGEAFEDILDHPQQCTGLSELYRATVISILVDGQKLSAPATANHHISEVRRLIISLTQNQIFTAPKIVQLVVTKLDILQGSGYETIALQQFAELGEELRHRTEPVCEVILRKIAARPPRHRVPHDNGLEDLISDWVKPAAPRNFTPCIYLRDSNTPMDRLMDRFSRLEGA